MEVIVGVDEVGRGCWAGPLLAAAVILDDTLGDSTTINIHLRDSKKMTKSQRINADVYIRDSALAFGIGWVNAIEVDNLGLTNATSLAMQRAVDQITIAYDRIIIDGNYNYLPHITKAETLVKADDTIQAVSAASIIAKVARDNFMAEQAVLFPQYGFNKHVGYGTKLHMDALARYGVTPLHRKSYKPIKVYL